MVHPLLALSSLSCVMMMTMRMRMNGAPVVSFEQLVLRDDDDDDDEDDWRDVMQLRKKTVMSCAGQVHDHIAVFGPR